tara:strand:- start:693 stop:1133 length:441 start_codon:yes stop_codon:yes gene_type:complete
MELKFLKKTFRWISLTLIVLVASFQYNFASVDAATMVNMNDVPIIEELRLRVPSQYKDNWINAEKEVWEPWLANKKGFLGREIFYNKEKEEALVLVKWANKSLWKSISVKEVNEIQSIFEENVKNELNLDRNPFVLIYEGELYVQG